MNKRLCTLASAVLFLLSCIAFAQGFPAAHVQWSLPAGGQAYDGVNQGFNLLSDIGNDTNSDTWSTIDINGDALPDLVCTGTRATSGYVTEFSPANNSYWKVYLNTGTGFSSSSTTWSLPAGGQVDNGVNQGFNLLGAIGNDTNSDTWSTIDINGDALPDLVCTGTRATSGYVTEFSPANNSYWKVYLNTGTGFSSSSTTWSLPAGGQVDNGVNQGFNLLGAIGNDTNSDTWSTMDINGDALPDLVCTGTRAMSGYVTEFSPANNSYWKVYLQEDNTGFPGALEGPGLMAYPNPASDRVALSSEQPLGAIEVLDVRGRTVLRKNVASCRAEIDLHQQPAGPYVVRVAGNNVVRTLKLMVE